MVLDARTGGIGCGSRSKSNVSTFPMGITMSENELDRLANVRTVALTTFRRNEKPVSTPVWIVPFGKGLGVITDGNSGKIKPCL